MGKPKILGLAVSNLASKPATIEYPKEPTPVEEDFRGRHYADLSKCTGCSLCSIECPADAIKMTPIPEGYDVPKSNPRRIYPLIDYGKCVYCYRCISVCPFNAYIHTNEYRLADHVISDSSGLSLSTLGKGGVK
ncbi:4Fe-4S binding protein [Desulfurococcus mucosus]|uniref:NADH-ubiquinone oxidoreductase, subunit I n=1 Tax=Desulfurococcus mucosus (strain ATCC 35584 / DSM 2162 / JCM 9187 / O7/1) TaxID=765177 RepID=E8R9E3_DESM0|nr:4Fe-4S binding protein [Desulfurococcus mucosus]ADV65119.1 NADH-ubiquinone oxidoreductase, subunit I [Desulfurococcus mucosus DSM 2162]